MVVAITLFQAYYFQNIGRMKKLSIQLLSCLFLGIITLSSCLKGDDDYVRPPAGYMTFINAFPESAGLHFQLDSRMLNNGYRPLPFREYTVAALYAGNRNIRVFPAEENRTLIDSTITVRDSVAYSSFVYGTKTAPKFAMTQDRSLENLGNRVAFRFLNLANGVSNVNVFIGNESTASFANRPVETGATAVSNQTFMAKETSNASITVTNASGTTIASRESYSFKQGFYYTLILIGTKDNSTTPLYVGVIAH